MNPVEFAIDFHVYFLAKSELNVWCYNGGWPAETEDGKIDIEADIENIKRANICNGFQRITQNKRSLMRCGLILTSGAR